MPLEPVTEYDQARYPTFEEMVHRRRDVLRGIGLAAIAAAFGPHVIGCSRTGDTQSAKPLPGTPPPTAPPVPVTTPPLDAVQLPGGIAPPRWPGPRGAIVGGGPIEIRYADGVTGWVAVAAVFDPSNQRLESALLDAEARVAAIVRERLAREPSGFLADAQRTSAAEAGILAAIRAAVGVSGLVSVALSAVDAEAAQPERQRARADSAPPPAARAAAPAPAAAMAPPMLAEPARPAASELPRRLPRAGAKCPIHPTGCRRSEASG